MDLCWQTVAQGKRQQRRTWGFAGSASGKESTCQCRRLRRCELDPWVRKIPWRRKWQPTPVFLPGESHGQRSLWAAVHGVTESDTTEHTHTHTYTHREGCWNVMGPAIPSRWFGRCLSTSLSCGIDKNVLRLVLSRNANSHHYSRASLMAGSVVGNPPASAGDTGSVPDPGRPRMP